MRIRDASKLLTNHGDHTRSGDAERTRAASPLRAAGVRVLIADGESLLRAAFKALLESDQEISVVGEAATGEEAVALAHRTRPDAVVMDSMLPGLDSIEAAGRMFAEVAVMLLTASEDDERSFAAVRAGVSGLVLKDAQPAELLRAVKALARGEALVPPTLTRRLIAELASRPQRPRPGTEVLDELTAREREVVALVGHGLDNEEIAERLVVTPGTAKTHVGRAMMKVHAHTRAKLVVFAYEAGLVVPRGAAPPTRQPLALAT